MAKKDWELGHLQALKKEEEKRAAEEEDEILYTYSREEALQVKKNKSKHRSRPNSQYCNRKTSSSKEPKNMVDSKEAFEGSVQKSHNTSRKSSRASSRSSSCSSSKRITRRAKFAEEI